MGDAWSADGGLAYVDEWVDNASPDDDDPLCSFDGILGLSNDADARSAAPLSTMGLVGTGLRFMEGLLAAWGVAGISRTMGMLGRRLRSSGVVPWRPRTGESMFSSGSETSATECRLL